MKDFDRLWAEGEWKIRGFVWRRVPNRDDADDLIQDVYLKARKGFAGFDGASLFTTWVYRIATNAVIDYIRKKRANRCQSLEELCEGMNDIIAPDTSVSDMVERDAVERASAELCPEHRDLIIGFYVNRVSYEDLATQQRIPVGTVRSRLHRAKTEMMFRLAS